MMIGPGQWVEVSHDNVQDAWMFVNRPLYSF
jgi:hypothetical protein